MARFSIFSKDGKLIRHEGEPQYNGSYMGVDYIDFKSISSPYPIEWEIGDYVDYYRTGKRYKLYSLPMPTKVARRGEYGASFAYSNVQLHAATKELEIAPFRDIVPRDNKIHFSTRPDVNTYENVYGIAARINECLNDLFPGRWEVNVIDTDDADLLSLLSEAKEFSVSNGSCLEALSQVYEIWKNIGWIHRYDAERDIDVITIGGANLRTAENTSDVFSYGIGKGLNSIKKAAANDGEFATRLYVYGSERNIQTRYYNGLDIVDKDSVDIRNLMLPLESWGKTGGIPDARKAYLQADDAIVEKYGLIPRTVYFDGSENEEIYPSIVGLTMNQVRQAMIDLGYGDSEFLPSAHLYRIDKIAESYSSSFDNGTKEETEEKRTFTLGIWQLGFDISEQGKLTSEGQATISIKSGPCAGREFKVKKCIGATEKYDGSKYLHYEVEKVWDESLGMGFPNKIYPINDGDEFVLLDIPMPDYYIALAEDRLLEAGEKMLSDYTRVSAFYEPSIDPIKIKEGGKLLHPGMYMQVYDEDIIETEDKKDYVIIDTLTIDESSQLPSYRVTLREQKRSARTYAALEDMITDVKEDARESVKRERQYTDRRFRSSQETIEMLQSAFTNFSEGISPVTVKTMALLIGDESLQYKFTESRDSLVDAPCPLTYDESTKQLSAVPASLVHMTLDIDDVTAVGTRTASDYKSWDIPAWDSAILDDGEARYVYVRVPMDVDSTEEDAKKYVLSKEAIGMKDETGYYHFLVGILNSEYNGTRDFVTLYGFTEILPGQITTDVIRSSSNGLVIDLLHARISAKNGATIDGSVTIEDGSLMSSRLDVGDTRNGNVVAFLNGGDFARDDSENNCGKLILAAGIPEGNYMKLEQRSKEANTRIYEDGCVYTNNMHLQNGCSVGDLRIINGRLIAGEPKDYDYTKGVILSGKGLVTQGKTALTKRDVAISIGDICPYYSMDIEIGNEHICHTYDKDVGLHINTPDAYSILSRAGMFAGLRPNHRRITTSDELTSLDHTIDSPIAKGASIRLTLPDDPQAGQCYEIWKWGEGTMYLNGNGRYIIRVGVREQVEHGLDASWLGIVKIIYSPESDKWLMTLHKTE